MAFPCQGLFAGVTGPFASSGVIRARAPTGVKLVGSAGQGRCPSGYLASKAVVLKGRAKVCAVYTFPLILYRLSVFLLPKNHRLAFQRSLFKVICRSRRLVVRRQVCCQHPRNGDLDMPYLENHWFAERLASPGWSLSTDAVWRRKASDSFLRLKSDPKAEDRRKLRGEALFSEDAVRLFATFLGPVTFLGLERSFQELVVDSAGRWGKFAHIRIGRQIRATWTIPSSRSPGSLHGTRCPFSPWAWQTCPIVLAAAVS